MTLSWLFPATTLGEVPRPCQPQSPRQPAQHLCCSPLGRCVSADEDPGASPARPSPGRAAHCHGARAAARDSPGHHGRDHRHAGWCEAGTGRRLSAWKLLLRTVPQGQRAELGEGAGAGVMGTRVSATTTGPPSSCHQPEQAWGAGFRRDSWESSPALGSSCEALSREPATLGWTADPELRDRECVTELSLAGLERLLPEKPPPSYLPQPPAAAAHFLPPQTCPRQMVDTAGSRGSGSLRLAPLSSTCK